MKKYKIEENQGERIDKIIDKIEADLSRSSIQRLISEGKILLNNKSVKSSYKVSLGDIITIEESMPQEASLKAQNIPLDIIYEDDDIILVNKAKGMVVHPGNGNKENTLANAVMR